MTQERLQKQHLICLVHYLAWLLVQGPSPEVPDDRDTEVTGPQVSVGAEGGKKGGL